MSRACELTGASVLFGNNVSHSERKTRRKFLPNLQQVSLFSEILKKKYRFRVVGQALKTVEKYGGLDEFLLKSKTSLLSKKAVRIKKVICKNTEKS